MNDTVIFLVLAGLALIFKWLTNRGSGDAEKPPRPNERSQPPRPPAESDAERVRRFLEALGAPPGTQPPPPVQPRRSVTPTPRAPVPKARRSWVQPLPPLVTTPEEMPLPPLTTAPPEPVVVFEAAPPPPIAAAPPPLPEPAASFQPAPSSPRRTASPRRVPSSSLGAMLRARGSVRRAIVLREILGPPRGLQAIDELRSF